jgi:hypothetical protein
MCSIGLAQYLDSYFVLKCNNDIQVLPPRNGDRYIHIIFNNHWIFGLVIKEKNTINKTYEMRIIKSANRINDRLVNMYISDAMDQYTDCLDILNNILQLYNPYAELEKEYVFGLELEQDINMDIGLELEPELEQCC